MRAFCFNLIKLRKTWIPYETESIYSTNWFYSKKLPTFTVSKLSFCRWLHISEFIVFEEDSVSTVEISSIENKNYTAKTMNKLLLVAIEFWNLEQRLMTHICIKKIECLKKDKNVTPYVCICRSQGYIGEKLILPFLNTFPGDMQK